MALIGAAGVIVSALISAVFSYITKLRLDRELTEFKAKLDENQERLKVELQKDKKQFDARVDYEYEAKKRLYLECKPRLFQAMQALTDADRRLWSLARQASVGRVAAKHDWFGDKYYFRSTVYRLFLPLAHLESIKRKLSQVDLSLDDDIVRPIVVLETLQSILGSEFEMARADPRQLPYKPHADVSSNKRNSQTAIYANQGFVRGEIDEIVAFILSGENRECLTWSEFDKKWTKSAANALKLSEEIFAEFQPERLPVLWRILIGYALCVRHGLNDHPDTADFASSVSDNIIASFDWRDEQQKAQGQDDKISDHVVAAADVVARLYKENCRRYGVGAKPATP